MVRYKIVVRCHETINVSFNDNDFFKKYKCDPLALFRSFNLL